jgi:hypothetical protein
MEGFFATLEELLLIVEWARRVQMIGYFVFMFFFMQLMVYLNAHPRVAILAQTVINGIDDVFHFFILAGFMFSVLAYLGHWMFGAQVEGFETFVTAGVRQFEMVVGEFPWDKLNGLSAINTIIFYSYFIVYTLIMFFIIINFLLAIIVEAFGRVKTANEVMVIENSCLSDVCDVLKEKLFSIYQYLPRALRKALPIMRHRLDYPKRYKVIQYLRRCEEDDKETMKVWYHTRPNERYNAPLRYDKYSRDGGTLKLFADAFGIDLKTAVSYISVYMTKVEEGIVMSRIQMENFDVNSRDCHSKLKERTLRLKDLGIMTEEAEAEKRRTLKSQQMALENGEGNLGGVQQPERRPPPVEEREEHEEYLKSIIDTKNLQLKDLKWRINGRNEEIENARKQHHTLVCLIEKQRLEKQAKDAHSGMLSIDNLGFSLEDDDDDDE